MRDGEPRDSTRILVGRVQRPHGVRGRVLLEAMSDVPERFAPGSVLDVVREGARPARRLTISTVAPHGKSLLVAFSECETRDAAEELRGAELFVDREASPPPPAGSVYYYDLIGRDCEDLAAGPLGRVVEVLEDGGGLLLRIDDADGRTLLVPFVADWLRSPLEEGGALLFDLPPGLIETCASTS